MTASHQSLESPSSLSESSTILHDSSCSRYHLFAGMAPSFHDMLEVPGTLVSRLRCRWRTKDNARVKGNVGRFKFRQRVCSFFHLYLRFRFDRTRSLFHLRLFFCQIDARHRLRDIPQRESKGNPKENIARTKSMLCS